MNADLLADGLGGGRGMSIFAVAAACIPQVLRFSARARARSGACRCCQRPWPPQPHDRGARADLPDRSKVPVQVSLGSVSNQTKSP